MRAILDRVLFIFPNDRELMFAAMSVVQEFVNTYDNKMAINDVSGGTAQYVLEYGVEAVSGMWEFFQKAGLELKYPRKLIEDPHMIVDMSEKVLARFTDPNKHVAQLYGSLCGIGCSPLPTLRRVYPRLNNHRWAWVTQPMFSEPFSYDILAEESQLLNIKDGEYTGFIGWAGWQTYLTCSYGMPTIEILPPNRSRQRLSKWSSMHYKMVEAGAGNIEAQVHQAIEAVEAQCLAALKDKRNQSVKLVPTKEEEVCSLALQADQPSV